MADTIVIVGNKIGDDYTTLVAAIAAVPSDIIATSGIWEIQVRDGLGLSARHVMPSPTSNSSFYLHITAFPGDEADGKGGGAELANSNSFFGVVEFGSGDDFIHFSKLRLTQNNTSVGAQCVKLLGANNLNFDSCVITRGIAGQNGSSGSAHFENCIHTTGGVAKSCFGGGNLDGTWSFNKNTFFGGGVGTYGLGDNESGTGTFDIQNSISFDFVLDFAVDSTGNFNASTDTSASSFSATAFDSRTSTTDLEDPYGITPDYNLKSTSTLKGAGSGGSDIGATLGAVSSGITLTVDSGSYSQAGTNTPITSQLNITTTSGSYLLTGSDVNLKAAKVLLAETGSYNLTGTDVTLTYTPSSVGEVLIVDSGVYSLSGDEVLLRADLSIIGNSGDYTQSGTSTNIKYAASLSANTASYSLAGANLNLLAAYGIITESIEYTLTGTLVTLKYSGDKNQVIGTVTAGFAADLYGVEYKQNQITVTFKV